MLVKLILSSVTFLCLLLIYMMLRNEAKPKKNLILGVTLPYEARQDDAVLAICKAFRRRLKWVVLLLCAVALALTAIPHFSVFLTAYLLLLIACVLLPYVPYIIAHKALKKYKAHTVPPAEAAGETLVELKLAAEPKQAVSGWWFVPPLLMAALPLAFMLFGEGDATTRVMLLALFGCNFLVTAFFAALYGLINRQRAEVVDDDASLTAALTRVRRYHWGRCWIALCWISGAFSLGLWASSRVEWGMLVLGLVYTALLCIACLRTEFAARRAQEALSAQSGRGFYADDDRYWLLGLIYYNPNDKHLSVNYRVGIGMTFNLAHWGGKLIMAISVLLLLALPLVGVWTMRLEFTPITLTVEADDVISAHTGELYRIPRDEVEAVTLHESLPAAYRLFGTGFDTFYQGTFEVEGYGRCYLCLNPQLPPFLLVETADARYLLGAAEAEAVRAAYDALAEN